MFTSNESSLETERVKIFHRFLPLIIIMCILGFFGLIGNTSAFIFFFFKCKRTSTFWLIGILAVADICVCVMIFPIVVDTIYNVANIPSLFCKLTYFFSLWSVAFSTVILTTISVDRHRMIWAPYQWQITLKSAKVISICGVTFCGFWTMRTLIIFDNFEINVDSGYTTVVGNYCKFNEKLASVATVFGIGDLLLILVEFIVIVVCYSMILFVIRKQANLKTKLQNRRNDNHNFMIHMIHIETSNETSINGISDSENISTINTCSANSADGEQTGSAEDVHTADKPSRQTIPGKKEKTESERETINRKGNTTSAQEKRVMFMMMTVTGFFLICFVPFLVYQIVNRSNRSMLILTTGYEVVRKIPFINSVVNPFIYLVFNAEYRQFLTPRWFTSNQGQYSI